MFRIALRQPSIDASDLVMKLVRGLERQGPLCVSRCLRLPAHSRQQDTARRDQRGLLRIELNGPIENLYGLAGFPKSLRKNVGLAFERRQTMGVRTNGVIEVGEGCLRILGNR